MPLPTKTKIHFDKIYCNKVRVGDWAKGYGKEGVRCILCNRSHFDHSGMAQINQHCWTAEHWKISTERFSTSQSNFVKSGLTITLGKPLDKWVHEAEVLWAFELEEQDWSFRSSDDTSKLFEWINFEEVAEKFKMGHTKMSYLNEINFCKD